MTVGELKALLSHFSDDCTIALPCATPFSTIGATPKVQIESAYAGFDWNQGTVFLKPCEPLYVRLETLRHASKAFEDIIGWHQALESKSSSAITSDGFAKIVGNIYNNYKKKTS